MPDATNLAGLPLFPREWPPSLRSAFVGRVDDLWRLHTALTEARLESLEVAARVAALQGSGGFGKTQLAREYVHRFGRRFYPGGCFWIDADGGLPLERQFHGILRTLRPETPASFEQMRQEQRDVRTELIDALHADAQTTSMLCVVDDVPVPPPGIDPKPIDTWCPGVGKITCLATSRKRLEGLGVDAIDLKVLETDSAVRLLTDHVPAAQLQAAEWTFIVEWVGCLPLALTLLNAALRKGALSVRALLELSEQTRTTKVLDVHREALRGTVPSGALRGITETFASSYRLLEPHAQELARHIAWLAPAALSDTLLSALSPPHSAQRRVWH